MGHETYEQMLERLVASRDLTDPALRFEALESIVQSMLEALRDTERKFEVLRDIVRNGRSIDG